MTLSETMSPSTATATNVTTNNSELGALQMELGMLSEQAWCSLGKMIFFYFIHSLIIGKLSHEMDEWDRALIAYESALRHNPGSISTLKQLARLLIERDQFGPAADVIQRVLTLTKGGDDEQIIAEMALCYLGMEDLGKAGVFIHRAIKFTEVSKEATGEKEVKDEEVVKEDISEDTEEIEGDDSVNDKVVDKVVNDKVVDDSVLIPSSSSGSGSGSVSGSSCHSLTLWYTIAVYHDRLGNEEGAIDAYLAFIESERQGQLAATDRTREVYYRLGVLYRLGGKSREARECFDFVRRQLLCSSSRHNQISGPCQIEVLMQLALVDECQGEVKRARQSLERLLSEASSSASSASSSLHRCRNLVPKLRQRLGCLALSQPTVFENDSSALGQLLKATEEDPQDALNWYFLGRLYLQLRQPTKAYDAYQQAVYRDGRNAAFWNSIGVLYFNIGQYRDALDAFTRAVHHAPHCAPLWWNLGLLYESCNGRNTEDSREAFQKGLEYAQAKDSDGSLVTKFKSKLQEEGGQEGQVKTSEVNAIENDINTTDSNNNIPTTPTAIMELDANRFTIRQLSAFPKPQSAASMSRFMTYRSQQQARRGVVPNTSMNTNMNTNMNIYNQQHQQQQGHHHRQQQQQPSVTTAAAYRVSQMPPNRRV